MSTLPPWKNPIVDRDGAMPIDWRGWVEGVDRFIGTPPEQGSTGTAANYDIGTSGGRVPVLAGGTVAVPNVWGGYNVFTRAITSQVGVKVLGLQVVGAQQASISDPTGGATVDTEGRAATAAILAALRAHGLIAT